MKLPFPNCPPPHDRSSIELAANRQENFGDFRPSSKRSICRAKAGEFASHHGRRAGLRKRPVFCGIRSRPGNRCRADVDAERARNIARAGATPSTRLVWQNFALFPPSSTVPAANYRLRPDGSDVTTRRRFQGQVDEIAEMVSSANPSSLIGGSSTAFRPARSSVSPLRAPSSPKTEILLLPPKPLSALDAHWHQAWQSEIEDWKRLQQKLGLSFPLRHAQSERGLFHGPTPWA